MTTKTPEQIARETFAKMHSQAAEACENEIIAHIVTAIEADRAQRAADLDTLADAASKWATELTDYVIPESANDGLREYMAERDEIQAALGRYLGEKEA